MKQQFSQSLIPDSAPIQYPKLNEIAERFDVLCWQHAALTEAFRELYNETEVQNVAPIKWHDLEHQVISLRFEIESFKQIF